MLESGLSVSFAVQIAEVGTTGFTHVFLLSGKTFAFTEAG